MSPSFNHHELTRPLANLKLSHYGNAPLPICKLKKILNTRYQAAKTLRIASYRRETTQHVVYANRTDQYDHVITLLGLLLDPMGDNPRRFDNAEVAAVRRALQLTYAHYEWEVENIALSVKFNR